MEKKKQTKKNYRLKLTDTTRYMAYSLSNLVNNLFEGIHQVKCKYGYDDKKK